MRVFICCLIGYLIGSLNPAALINKIKNNPQSEKWSFGATNVMLKYGKMLGAFVMIFDILKSLLAVLISGLILPQREWIGLLCGIFVVLGHCFPLYFKFKGGKGLAAFGGVVLAYSPLFFLFLLISGIALVLIFNRGTVITYYAALLFPVYISVTSESMYALVAAVFLCELIMILFIPNLKKALNGDDFKLRDFVKRIFKK